MSTYLDAVNRVLRTNGFLGDDDDDLESFTTTQHQASMNVAKIAVTTTLTSLISDQLIPHEQEEANITYTVGERAYQLDCQFIRFAGDPYLVELDDDGNPTTHFLWEFKGGENRLRKTIHNYRTTPGKPIWWYYINTDEKKIGVYPVPDTATTIMYIFEKDLSISNYKDILPFNNTMEFDAFCNMSSRTFKYVFEKSPMAGLEGDVVYATSKATFQQLVRPLDADKHYGATYS